MKPKFKYEKGITLISLVVTIIVLIILAGVSINLTLGENGIITVAKRAKENVELAEIEEQKALNELYSEMDNANNETPEEVVIESGIWRAKKSTESKSSAVEIYVYSIYYTQTVPDTLNEYKEQYIVKTYNEMSKQYGSELSFNNFDEMILYFMNETDYTLINDYIVANSIDKTREEIIVETLKLKCETSEYANTMLEELGYTAENIAEIEKEYEEYKNNQNVIEIPDEIKTATYIVTYPDGTTEEVLGSDLNSFKGTYNVQDNGNNVITIAKLDEVTKLEVAVSNLMKTYTDEWYIYKYNTSTNGYGVKVKDKTLTEYGQIKNDIYGVPITSLYGTYADCNNVTSLSFENVDTSNVKDMSYMFSYCKALTNLNVSNLDTSKVTNMSCMFQWCKSLTSLNVSNFNTSNVTDMYSMFHNCTSLTSLDLSSFNTSNVTNMCWMFNSCSSLESLNLSSFDTSNVTNMHYMFHHCNKLTSLDLSSFNTSNVTDMENMFEYCKSLTALDLSSFNTSKVTNMNEMFQECSALTSLNVSSFDTSNVTDMGNMFESCTSLTSLDLSSFNAKSVTYALGMFDGCSSLTSLDLSSFNTSNVTNMNYMFHNCNKLTSLDLKSFDTRNVLQMRSMFEGCTLLTKIYVGPNWTTANVLDTTDMFSACGTSEVDKSET